MVQVTLLNIWLMSMWRLKHGVARWHSTAAASNLSSVIDRVKIHECDLCDLGSVYIVYLMFSQHMVFHLASHANVRAGFITPISVIQNNVIGTLNLFEAIAY